MNLANSMEPCKFGFITFNFNGYDCNRTHSIVPGIDYVYVTDKNYAPNEWRCKCMSSKNDPWYNSIYVRYHPFEFTDAEYVIVIDGSMSSNRNVKLLFEEFERQSCDIGVLLSYSPYLTRRIISWEHKGEITTAEAQTLRNLVNTYLSPHYKGTIAGAVHLYKKSDKTLEYLNKCWELININPTPIRLDEIPSTIALELVKDIKVMPLSTHLIQGDVFQYHWHKSDKKCYVPFSKSHFWLHNKPINPILVGDMYCRKYDHKIEAMCLTRYFSESEMKFWLDYHFAKGFDHIHIFDNESKFNCKALCELYGDKVSYDFVPGKARHYKLFNEYVNSDRCKSEWIIPIDDDEYLDINETVGTSVSDLLSWFTTRFPNDNMFAIRWKHLFPKIFHSDPDGNILDYCTEVNPKLASSFQRMGDRGIKTLVRRYGRIYYEETEENPSGGHVPKHNLSYGARFFNGELIRSCACKDIPIDPIEPARLLHCRYKGYTWYKNKNSDIKANHLCLDNTSGLVYTRKYRFNEILETLK